MATGEILTDYSYMSNMIMGGVKMAEKYDVIIVGRGPGGYFYRFRTHTEIQFASLID